MKKPLAAVIALALVVPLSAVAQQEETYDYWNRLAEIWDDLFDTPCTILYSSVQDGGT